METLYQEEHVSGTVSEVAEGQMQVVAIPILLQVVYRMEHTHMDHVVHHVVEDYGIDMIVVVIMMDQRPAILRHVAVLRHLTQHGVHVV